MTHDQTYELFARSLMQTYASRLDLPYEAFTRDYRELTERAERARLLERWNAVTPDGRTVGEVLMAEARMVTRDADLPAVGSFHG